MELGLRIKKIIFLGDEKNSSINFCNSVHFVHGASNTGKSLLVEAIDYILGKKELRQVLPQSQDYNELAMQVTLDGEPFTIFREWPSKTFEVYHEHINSKENAKFYNYFRHGNPTKTVGNINDFYFKNQQRPEILKNLYGEKSSLTIRLLSRVMISGEEKIISSDSPIIAGDTNENSKNKYVFKYLLTGKDDSKVKAITRGNEFKSEKRGQLEVLEEVVKSLEADLNFPDESTTSLNERNDKLESSINSQIEHIDNSQKRLTEVVNDKKRISQKLLEVSSRIDTIRVNLTNFDTLKRLYLTDIERLGSQEEAAFLLSVGHHAQCNFCGKTPENLCEDLHEVNTLADASKAEIRKIQSKYSELEETNGELQLQLLNLEFKSGELQSKLGELDREAEKRAPSLKNYDQSLVVLRKERSSIQSDLKLRGRINTFKKRLQETEVAPTPKQYKSEDFYPNSDSIESFCQIYSSILQAINFPGEHKVAFDHQNCDVVINDTPRNLNGKGVRAILHSVFKVALLMHCRINKLYHPGIVILDSPLVTYRDPLNSKYGELSRDEQELAATKISYYFLNFLNQIHEIGQFIIVENIDLPESLQGVIGSDTFYGVNATVDQRCGLL